MPLSGALLLALAALALAGVLSAPLALASGLVVGIALGNPWPGPLSRAGKSLLQASVVGLGFGVSLGEVWEAGRAGVVYTIVGIAATLLVGRALGRLLRVPERTAALVTFGTAICGGSAIAAMAPVLEARDEEIGASLATVFTLNAVALFLFPPLGGALGLSQEEFGLWAALAIHDTSSVVAAGSVYGATALAVATTVKLARAVWIAPITLGAAWLTRTRGRVTVPWFILGFLAAAALRALAPAQEPLWRLGATGAKRLLVVTLVLIGAGMTREVLARVGARPLVLGVVLWVLVASGTLLLVAGSPVGR